MTINRENLLGKIRGLLSKTMDNGCTEAEALAALDKARAMMDAYEVTDEDLKLTKEEAAILASDPVDQRDAHGVRIGLAMKVAEFSDCEVWRNRAAGGRLTKGLVFCGLPSDVQQAQFLIETLAGFVQGELAGHLMGSLAARGDRRLAIASFVMGCTGRISKRLGELIARSKAAPQTSNGTALVIVKGQAITSTMKAAGINLQKSRSRSQRVDRDSFAAGQAAGDRATFGQGIGGGQARRLA